MPKNSNALLPAPATSFLPQYVRSERKLGVVLVGLGKYSHDHLAPALRQTEFCELVGVVTDDPDEAREWMETYQLPPQNCYDYQTFYTVRNNPNVDVVYVVTPNATHVEYVVQAAEAGKHVICEKPLGISVEDCETMIAACRKAGVQLAVGYRLHFDPTHREAARLGQHQAFGPVKYLELAQGFRVERGDVSRLDPNLSGGGPLMDVGIYCVNAARSVTGEEPVAVTAQWVNTHPDKFKGMEETLVWQLRFPGGCLANCASTYAGQLGRFYALAEKGWFEIAQPFGYDTPKGRSPEGEWDFHDVYPPALLLDEVAQCILQDIPNPVPGEEGLRDLRVMEAIYKAAETGREVRLEHG
jgi:predicted dehydrogenase